MLYQELLHLKIYKNYKYNDYKMLYYYNYEFV